MSAHPCAIVRPMTRREKEELETLDEILKALHRISRELRRLVEVFARQATTAILSIEGDTMPITIGDTSTIVSTFDPAGGSLPGDGSGLVSVFSSDDTSVATVGGSTLNADGTYSAVVSWVGAGDVNLTEVISNTSGSPLLDADGETPFVQPAALAETVAAAQVTTATLSIND